MPGTGAAPFGPFRVSSGHELRRKGLPRLIALLLALFAFFAGNLENGATAWGSALALIALVGLALAAPALSDPWRLGRGWRWLPWVLTGLVFASLAASAVQRAGIVGAILVPAFLLAPAVFSRRLAGERSRRLELLGIAVLVTVVAGWALLQWMIEGTPRPARPLGHHNLLASFLVLLLPLALVPLRSRGPERWLGGVAGALGVAAVVASRSLSGGLALVVELGLAVGIGISSWSRDRRKIALAALAAAGLTLVLFQGSRLLEIAGGTDLSARARRVYFDAGLAGIGSSPLLGHGPGSTAWTIAAFTRPLPGVTPPGEALGELHSLPLAVAYELGLLGFGAAIVAAGAFVLRRWRERREPGATDPTLALAGLIGLAGGLTAGLGTAEWRVTALPLTAAVAMGAALAGGKAGSSEAGGSRTLTWAVRLAFLAVAMFVLVPKIRANFLYEKALGAGDATALESALRLDPTFPLYSARLAWARSDADGALAAARAAGAVPALWAQAAHLGVNAGASWSRSAALVACRLDPLLPVGSWLALVADPAALDAPRLGAHALATDPRLGAAETWRDHPRLLADSVVLLEQNPGLDTGWRQAAVELFRTRTDEGPTARLGLGLDDDPARSVSLVTFRRQPWPELLAPVRVRAEKAGRLAAELPSAALLPGTSAQVLLSPCRPDDGPQELWKTLRKSP